MTPLTDNYSLLIAKLDEFIRKYYKNQLIRGSLFTLAFILGLYLVVSVAEYFFFFPSGIRRVLFFGFILTGVAAIYRLIGIPALHYFKLGSIISHEQAARIIGSHFGTVQDRLLNILQLRKQAGTDSHR